MPETEVEEEEEEEEEWLVKMTLWADPRAYQKFHLAKFLTSP